MKETQSEAFIKLFQNKIPVERIIQQFKSVPKVVDAAEALLLAMDDYFLKLQINQKK